MDFAVFVLAHILAHTDIAGGTFFFDLIGEEGAYLAGRGNVKDIDFGGGFVGGAEVERTETEEAFPEGASEGDVENPVEADLILTGVEDAGFDDEAVFREGIDRERPRQTEDVFCPSRGTWRKDCS